MEQKTWSEEELTEYMRTHDGYLPISYLMSTDTLSGALLRFRQSVIEMFQPQTEALMVAVNEIMKCFPELPDPKAEARKRSKDDLRKKRKELFK